MIAPKNVTDNNEIYSRLLWNDFINDYFLEEEGEESDNLISRFITPEVSLDLQKVYILVTSTTASASEMVINCLSPYMDVTIIGPENTTGKYVGSITVRAEETDYDNWAMQPIVLKTANVNGISDYSNGFAPEYLIKDDFNAALGTLEEDMLATAVELITGIAISETSRLSTGYFPDNVTKIQPQEDLIKQRLTLDY
jgi:hypothetical protein